MAFRYRGQVNLKPNPVPGAFDTLVCQGDESWATQPRHQRLLPGAVEVDPPNVPAHIIGPVHQAPNHIEDDTGRLILTLDEGFLARAVEVRAKNRAGPKFGPVHLAA